MVTRRSLLSLPLGLAAGALASVTARDANAQDGGKVSSPVSPNRSAGALQFSFTAIDGGPLPLSQFAGRALLIVNTASKCGFTPQYRGLQELWMRLGPRGLTIIGVPSNDFGGQEPGSNADIAEFCGRDYGVTFPMAGKERVLGESAHPFFVWAARQRPTETPGWNFHKYLIGRDGRMLGSFATRIAPNDPRLVTAIEQALAKAAS
jgi:glutathione peroxidase